MDALERLFAKIPASTSLAFVVAQHLSPDHKSMMVDLLAKRTPLTVAEAFDRAPIKSGTVYLVPAHSNVVVDGNCLRLSDRAAPHSLNLPVDQLLRSIAASFGDHSVAVILSGTGSDGREGVLAVKNAGGTALAQDPQTARFDGMPREAIRTGVVDAVLSPEDLALELESICGDRQLLARLADGEEPEGAFLRLVAQLKASTGFDLAAYKQSMVLRRLERRLTALDSKDLDSYTAFLRGDADEGRRLIEELLINVTEFFRDRELFEQLEARHLPELHAVAGPLRVWVCGCATGEEAYSIAMLLSELGADYKIFGTDVDELALAKAAAGIYPADAVRNVSAERLERFFLRRDAGYEVDRELRKRVVFAPHDVLADPPFTRMHMVSCRNLLIYLTPEAQRRVVEAFAFALRASGLLVLGASEVIGERIDEFKPVDSHLKIYSRREGRRVVPTPAVRGRTQLRGSLSSDEDQAAAAALRILTDRVAPAAVLVNEQLRLIRVFGNAGSVLTLGLGEPTLDLQALLPDSLRVLSSIAVHRAFSTSDEVRMAVAENSSIEAVRAVPFVLKQVGRFALVVFEATVPVVQVESSRDPEEMEVLRRELNAARQSLQAAVEELEASNEELQATNEELLASNEELQATNEELQSVNEELHTVNVEHQLRITDLSDANADLDNLLNATPVATVFLDEKLRVRRFNPEVTAIFPLVETDRGRPLTHFTSSLLTTPLASELELVLSEARPFEREVATVSGLRFYMRAVPHIGAQRRVCGVVMTFSNITALHESREAQELLQGVLDALPANVAVLDDAGTIQFVNQAWLEFARSNGGGRSSVGSSYIDACREAPETRMAIEAVLRGQRRFYGCEYPCHSATKRRWFMMHVQRTHDGRRTIVVHTEVTHLREGS
ncbi:MAG: PAS domain-containing protein [Deltaproteobacteria bacterium]|nr:PAS domain-containing protein [Deltaproteobacteria bacterium]